MSKEAVLVFVALFAAAWGHNHKPLTPVEKAVVHARWSRLHV